METPPPHLEKMGRELKCPICLSLLSSAVSLNCNHLFCNACIVKSMKSGSNCPVCKIPYRRREVRPAPHMDNLVSIYKSMEDASGINIFVTQNAPSTKSSEEIRCSTTVLLNYGKQQAEDDFSHGEHDLSEFQDRAQKQKTIRGKGSRNAKANLKSSGSISIKPSFPNKKRVQVPQCPISETPTCHQKLEGDLMADRAKQSSKTLKEKPVLNEKGEPVLSPFFWLNDKDVESLSQFSFGDQLTDLPSPNVPAFSDIKDSDDENSVRLTQPGEVHGTSSHAADLFDSEIFEWTQIPCSPELFPSPPKMQVGEDENDRVQLKELKEVSQNKKSVELSAKSARSKRNKKSTGNMDFLPDLPAAGTKAVTNESDKRGRKAKNLTKRKCATSHTDPGTDINVTLKGSEVFYEGQACENYGSSLAKTRKRSKKEHSSVVVTKPTSENVHVLSTRADSRINGDENGITASPTSLGKNAGGDEPSSKKAGKMCREVNDKNKIDGPVRSKKKKMVSMQKTMLEASEIQKQANKDTPTELSLINLPTDDNQKASESWNNSRKLARKAKLGDQELKRNKKVKVSSDDNSKDDTSVGIGEGHGHVNENGNQPAEKSKGNCNVTTNQSPVQKLPSLTKNVVLKRCEIPSKIQCAFCLSSEESEASGEIGHYYNGKPVAADHNGGLKVIHAHRICAEWAPNVYFEEDIAINLEAELTRSRKIKCSCCAIKGAALGCYEKSCRRSFHVTCAKLMPQCRWDTDNFVMLCPVHASSKLPNESPESQATRKKSNPKKQPNVECPKVAAKQHSNTSPDQKFCGPSKKLVLCCSSLTNAERESVSGFERLSGLTVLQNWDSNVTHVIASTDENGACRRTLKVLMGILEGKWILNVGWINACTEGKKLVDEEPYEINFDIYGIRDGPRLGRLRLQNKQPKLFDGFKFYFMGDFKPSYKGYLQDLVIAAGGTILQRKPVPEGPKALSAGSPKCQTYIIYSLELPDQCHRSKKSTIFNTRQADAKALASSAGVMAVSNSWVLNSIAACKLQNLSDFE